MSLLELFFLGFVASTFTGAALTYCAFRGRRIGDHLHCRKCTFDLHGLSIETNRCPECGTLIRYGQPRGKLEHRPLLMRWGLSLGTVGVLGLIVVFGSLSHSVRWRQQMPVWYLLSSLRAAPTRVRTVDYLGEIQRRVRTKSLSVSDTQQIGAALVELHNETRLGNRLELAEMIENLHAAGLLTMAQWTQYLNNSLDIDLEIRPVVGEKDPIGAMLVIRGDRLGGWKGTVTVVMPEAEIDEKPAYLSHRASSAVNSRQTVEIPSLVRAGKLAPDKHTLTIHYQLILTDPLSAPSTQSVIEGALTRPFAVEIGFDPLIAVETSGYKYDRNHFTPLTRISPSGQLILLLSIPPSISDVTYPSLACEVLYNIDGKLSSAGGFVSPNRGPSIQEFGYPQTQGNLKRILLKPSRERALSNPRAKVYLNREIEIEIDLK